MPPKPMRINAQVGREQLIALQHAAKVDETSLSDVMREFAPPSEVWVEALGLVRALGRVSAENLSLGDALYITAAKGLRATMQDAGLPFRLDPQWLAEVCGTADNAALTFVAFFHACRHLGGVKMPDESAPLYKFAELPKGGKWEKEGRAGNHVIIAVEDSMSPDTIISNPFAK